MLWRSVAEGKAQSQRGRLGLASPQAAECLAVNFKRVPMWTDEGDEDTRHMLENSRTSE